MSLTKVLGNGSKVQCRKYRMGVYSLKIEMLVLKYSTVLARIGVPYRTVQKNNWLSLQLYNTAQ
jgi:hypothetical protein